jgi:hypothetical protein
MCAHGGSQEGATRVAEQASYDRDGHEETRPGLRCAVAVLVASQCENTGYYRMMKMVSITSAPVLITGRNSRR